MTPRGRIRAVVFDVGETLVDETRSWGAWADWLGVPRLTLFAVLGAVIAAGEPHWQALERVRPGIDVRAEESRRIAAGGRPWVTEADLYPDAVPALRAIRAAGYRLGVAANQPVATETVIRGLGLDFDIIAASGRLGIAKPDPRFFAWIAEALALEPSAIAYVGDRIDNDIRPAAATGMAAILIRRGPWGYIHAADGATDAVATIDSLADLPAVLGAID